ncbi:MAG: PEP-utilizing enzyme [Armatimonadota bacterium]|nr:PEP-utilizing enzyme [Armatimonadota bacterium]MDR7439308.1 PEP-utilizing enzyme [Armatimonadota bacterium]MDR7561998.1 PEP-utilizing enzyme [Armatimonadota bacterium]MDR7568406.1 PEP-utilizing enzyme [Armatimonadota bacterium]MDR7602799.1 PEP-utilizing enzyme [Armatimonadota bacterium]
MKRAFPSPFEIPTPPGAEGWEEMYPPYLRFTEHRRAAEESRLWVWNSMHFPEPIYPFDIITADDGYIAIGQINTRVFLLPTALGIEHRVLNGYVYISGIPVTDPKEVEHRARIFTERAGYYYRNWNDLYEKWLGKVQETIRELEALQVPDLPGVEPASLVTEGRGLASAYDLLVAYHRLLESFCKIYQYHFELLVLGYAAYLSFTQFCKQHFPEISDQTIAKMVAGLEQDIPIFRPDEELKRLARLAVALGVAATVKRTKTLQELEEALSAAEAGRRWLQEFHGVQHPWFYYSCGNGFYHYHGSWVENLDVPLSAIRRYVELLEAGERIDRDVPGLIAERDRITAAYRALLPDEATRRAFDETLGLARTVFPYVEGHGFYVEHWHWTVFWQKARQFGKLLAKYGFLRQPQDVFCLHRHEVSQALEELRLTWATGGEPLGPKYWPPIVARRRAILERLREWTPPPALGPAPDEVTDPMLIMLWGVTTERIQEWLGQAEGGEKTLTGYAASPGVVEGTARVIRAVEQLDEVQPGEILVAPLTMANWTPVFARIRAVVCDIGGIMSHAAIVAREYGLPAVVGTRFGTSRIRTGQRIRVDGDRGVVTVLE